MKSATITHISYKRIVWLNARVWSRIHMCVNEWEAKGYITLKIILIISSPSPVSLGLLYLSDLSFSFSPHYLSSCCVYLCFFCYIPETALGSLKETVKGDFHREKYREVVQTERRVLLAEGILRLNISISINQSKIFLLFILYSI